MISTLTPSLASLSFTAPRISAWGTGDTPTLRVTALLSFGAGAAAFFSSPQPVIKPVSANAATDAMIVFLNFMKNSSFDVLA